MQHLLRFLLVCGAVAAVACDSTSPAPSGIGTTGGTAMSSNSAAQVVIPAGALTANTVVTVTPASAPPALPGLVAASAFEFGPSGTTFSAPVTITIKYDPATLPAGVPESSLQLYTLDGATWTPVAGSTVNVVAHTISGATIHFSLYAPVGVVPVSAVAVTAPAATVTVGATSQLTAQTKDASGTVLTGRTIAWSSSDAGRATVSASGLVTGVAVGAVTITAASEGKSGSLALTVAPVPVASVTLAPSTAAINVGSTITLVATPKDAAGNALTGRTVTWTSSDATKATVSSAGVVTGVAVGSATITAASEGISSTATVTVSAAAPPAANVAIQVLAIAEGDLHACGISANGSAYCWGYGGNGIGDGTSNDRLSPALALGGLNFASIQADANLTCGITTINQLYCWGGGSQLTPSASPVGVGSGIKWASISVASSHICGVATDGTGYCEGANSSGALGTGQSQSALPASTTFLPVAGGLTWKQISVSSGSTCGISSAGALYCWGNTAGYLSGAGAVASSATPILITNAVAFAALTPKVQSTQACGLLAGGEAYCVGSGLSEFGGTAGATVQIPVRVSGTTTFKSLSHFSDNLCGVGTNDVLYCLGGNGYGVLGTGDTSKPGTSPTPITVMAGTSFSAVSVGAEQTVCAITTAGVGYCWGYNFYGQVGDGTKTNRPAPTAIQGGITFRAP